MSIGTVEEEIVGVSVRLKGYFKDVQTVRLVRFWSDHYFSK